MQFVPLWTHILRSRKVAALPDDLYRTWTFCLLAAQEYDHRGGTLPPTDDLSYALHTDTASLVSRLSRLSRAGFLEDRDGVFVVHDWDDWKHRPDPTAAARKRAQRERDRLKKKGDATSNGNLDASENVTVTGVTSRSHGCHAPTQLNSTQLTTPPLTPRHGGNGCVDDEELEPFDPGPPTFTLPPSLPPDKQRVLDRQVQRWGASNGDRVVGDLLVDYSAEIVDAACQHHHLANNGVLNPRVLLGICRAMHAGTWKLPPKGKQGGPENQPAKSDPDVLARIEAELAKRPKISPKDFDGGKRVG